mgnify:FL=1
MLFRSLLRSLRSQRVHIVVNDPLRLDSPRTIFQRVRYLKHPSQPTPKYRDHDVCSETVLGRREEMFERRGFPERLDRLDGIAGLERIGLGAGASRVANDGGEEGGLERPGFVLG